VKKPRIAGTQAAREILQPKTEGGSDVFPCPVCGVDCSRRDLADGRRVRECGEHGIMKVGITLSDAYMAAMHPSEEKRYAGPSMKPVTCDQPGRFKAVSMSGGVSKLHCQDHASDWLRHFPESRLVEPRNVSVTVIRCQADWRLPEVDVPPLVVIESPYAGDVAGNVAYAKRCVLDSLEKGEAPYASHLFFTQEGILDDLVPAQRKKGIEAGLAWGRAARTIAVYVDRGVSQGMRQGILAASKRGANIEVRTIDRTLTKEDLRMVYDACEDEGRGSR